MHEAVLVDVMILPPTKRVANSKFKLL